jgi:predicted CopG family antitoxin
MHSLCMATKTISLRLEAYEKLRRARRYAGESFSEVVLRASWPEETATGAELLERYRGRGPFFSEEALERIERLKAEDRPPEDKWRRA